MPKLTIEMTQAELFALDLIAYDKQAWADNVLTERARVAIEELKTTPEWVKAAIAAGSTDDSEILLKGKELGLFKTAKQRHEEFLAAEAARLSVVNTDK
jgi:hypothetical protein